MKKIYKKPMAKIIELETELPLAISNTTGDEFNPDDVTCVGEYRKKLWED